MCNIYSEYASYVYIYTHTHTLTRIVYVIYKNFYTLAVIMSVSCICVMFFAIQTLNCQH